MNDPILDRLLRDWCAKSASEFRGVPELKQNIEKRLEEQKIYKEAFLQLNDELETLKIDHEQLAIFCKEFIKRNKIFRVMVEEIEKKIAECEHRKKCFLEHVEKLQSEHSELTTVFVEDYQDQIQLYVGLSQEEDSTISLLKKFLSKLEEL